MSSLKLSSQNLDVSNRVADHQIPCPKLPRFTKNCLEQPLGLVAMWLYPHCINSHCHYMYVYIYNYIYTIRSIYI